MRYNDRDEIIQFTPLWKGERFEDGRPKVPAETLEKLRQIDLEECWEVPFRQGYDFQFQDGFMRARDIDEPTVGRAVTCSFMPIRGDLEIAAKKQMKDQGMGIAYHLNVIDSLQEDDVMVADFFDKGKYGTIIGGNLAQAIESKTKRGGLVCWGGVRDLAQLEGRKVNYYFRHNDPTAIRDHVMMSWNSPVRIGGAVCVPGDVVYACRSGVLFIPAHLAEQVVISGYKTKAKDVFGFERLAEGKYKSDQIDSIWSAEVWDDMINWCKTSPNAADFRDLDWTQDKENDVSGKTAEMYKRMKNPMVISKYEELDQYYK